MLIGIHVGWIIATPLEKMPMTQIMRMQRMVRKNNKTEEGNAHVDQ